MYKRQKYGCAFSALTREGEQISSPSINGRSDKVFSRQALSDVIEQRYAEIFNLIKQRLAISDFSQALPAGFVLTGGASKIEGISQLGEEIFQIPVRVGQPSGLVGLTDISPKFVKQYINIGELIKDAAAQYRKEVMSREFPTKNHVYGMKPAIVKKEN